MEEMTFLTDFADAAIKCNQELAQHLKSNHWMGSGHPFYGGCQTSLKEIQRSGGIILGRTSIGHVADYHFFLFF
jgi:hypothetical protein